MIVMYIVVNCLKPYFSNFNVLMIHLGILLNVDSDLLGLG